MACAILSLMYGRDTRPAQVLNTLVSVLWVVLLLIQEFNIEAVKIPPLFSRKLRWVFGCVRLRWYSPVWG